MDLYKPTIGIEVHAELKTNSKMFSSSRNEYGSFANLNVNEVDLGYPGTLPTVNKKAVELALRAAIILNCKINKRMHFDRKNYFYADNPKNYQITQSRTPIGVDGYVEIEVDGVKKKIGIQDIHIEEDTCKSIHYENTSFLDFNRAGVPLIEIVTKPDISSSIETVLYLERLRELLFYADISDVKIEEGSMRCDVNVSVSKSDMLGTKIEIKNIGSITNAGEAVDIEVKRQVALLEMCVTLKEETRRLDEKKHETILMRVKETGNDYRYFPDPDIPFIELSDEYIESVKDELPLLPDKIRDIYLSSGISLLNTNKIIQNRRLCEYLNRYIESNINLVIASNLLLGDISFYLNKSSKLMDETKLNATKFIDVVNKLDRGEINSKIFKEILTDIMEKDLSVSEILNLHGVSMLTSNEIIEIIKKVITNNPESVKQYREGQDRGIKYLMGQIMKETKGNVDPTEASRLLMEQLNN